MRAAAIVLIALAAGCGAAVSPTAPDPVDASVDATMEAPLDTTTPDAGPAPQCSNGIDDDGDGLIDHQDHDCTGDRDDDERTLGLGNAPEDPCNVGCRFDRLSGADDPCLFPGECIANNLNCRLDAAVPSRECKAASDACRAHCLPLVPENCDCTGCCLIKYDGRNYMVRLNDGCSVVNISSDVVHCQACSMDPSCSRYMPPPFECPTKCDPMTPCPAGQYCLTGCCLKPG